MPVGAQRAVEVGAEDGGRARRPAARAGRCPSAVASTSDLVRSRSTIWVVAATPTSAASRSSSTSSQSSSVSFSRASTVSRPRPREDCDRASRERSRTSRPADGGGVSKISPGSGSAGGSSTAGGASGWTTSGWSTGAAASARGFGRSRPGQRRAGRRVVVQACRPASTADQQGDPGDQRDDEDRDRDQHEFHAGVSQHATADQPCARLGHAVRPEPARLLLGPLLRHVDPVSATVWVETDRACEVDVLGPPGAHVLRRRPPLRAGRGRGPRAGQHARRTRCAWTATRCGRRSVGVPAQPDPHARAASGAFRIAFGSCRYATPEDGGGRRRHPAGRAGLLRQRSPASRRTAGPTPWCCSATRSTPTRLTPPTRRLAVAAPRRGRGRRTPRSRTSRSTPGSTPSPGATRRCGGCCRRSRRR